MIRSLLLAAVVLSLPAWAHANQGTINFSGRIVDAGCNVGLVHDQQQLDLEGCPLSAQGAQLQVSTLNTGDIIAIPAYHEERGLAAQAVVPGMRVFSKSYALQATADRTKDNGYLVVVTYP